MRNQLLRQMLQAGVLSPEDLTPEDMAELSGAMPQPRNDIALMAMNTMRTETGPDAGRVIPLAPGATGSDGLTWDQVRAATGAGGGQRAQQMQRMKVKGMGGGMVSDLGERDMAMPALDLARPGIEIAGVGKGQYGKDGKVYIPDGQGGYTQVIQGYDAAGSWDSLRRMMDRQKAEQGMRRGEADIAHVEESTAASQAQRAIKEDPNTQAAIERRWGKADKGMIRRADGTQVADPGGSVDQNAQGVIEQAGLTIQNLDTMIGKRDAAGNLAEGGKAHPGFEGTVGATWKPGMRLIPGTVEADFDKRLGQVRGGAFLRAFESLKGGGAISEKEGEKATAAMTRMDRSQSETEFIQAAMEFRQILQNGLQRAQAMRGGNAAPMAGAQPGGVPAPAMELLKRNPALAADFDRKYGQGAAARVLGR